MPIVDSDKLPERNIYYIGAVLLEILKGKKSNWDIIALFDEYNKRQHVKISFDYHILGLNWLYILGLVEHDPKGQIVLCS